MTFTLKTSTKYFKISNGDGGTKFQALLIFLNSFCTFTQASMWWYTTGNPPMGNSGLGNSRERGRNLVPEKDESKSSFGKMFCKTKYTAGRRLQHSFRGMAYRNELNKTIELGVLNFLPFIGPPIRITTLIMFSTETESFDEK